MNTAIQKIRLCIDSIVRISAGKVNTKTPFFRNPPRGVGRAGGRGPRTVLRYAVIPGSPSRSSATPTRQNPPDAHMAGTEYFRSNFWIFIPTSRPPHAERSPLPFCRKKGPRIYRAEAPQICGSNHYGTGYPIPGKSATGFCLEAATVAWGKIAAKGTCSEI